MQKGAVHVPLAIQMCVFSKYKSAVLNRGAGHPLFIHHAGYDAAVQYYTTGTRIFIYLASCSSLRAL